MTAVEPLRRLLAKLDGVRRSGDGYVARCPAHDDRRPSLSIRLAETGKVQLKCFAGCETAAVLGVIGLSIADLYPETSEKRNRTKRKHAHRPVSPVTAIPGADDDSVTVAALAEDKHLNEDRLGALGVTDVKRRGKPAVRIPYFDVNGDEIATRYRLSLTGAQRFAWQKGARVMIYGLQHLRRFQELGWVLLVEGETDCWAGWQHGVPVLGLPGKSTWKPEWSEFFVGFEVFLWQEPDAADLVARVARDLPDVRIIIPPDGLKDLCDAHVRGSDVVQLIEELRTNAKTVDQLRAEDFRRHAAQQFRLAESVMRHPDPLGLVSHAIRQQGYGGELRPTLLTYLAVTSRLLAVRPGGMLVHLLLVGPPSAGKSYTVKIILGLMPPEAYHTIDAGSPRALIYDNADLRHRVLVFGEADSLPAGEDNAAASAVRNLLQDGHLHYLLTVRDPETGDFTVREIQKPGPTVLITTATRKLGEQLDSRLFSIDIADDQEQIRQALLTQASLELHGSREPDPALIAYQAYLQSCVPWDVVVPFADALARRVGASPAASRVLRDFARLLSLIKAVTVIRHTSRTRDREGRLIAEHADYATVYDLLNEVYVASASGASDKIREAVAAVAELKRSGRDPITVVMVGEQLGINKMAASRRVKTALQGGWLTNLETRRHHPYKLDLGEPLPQTSALPSPEELDSHAVTPETGESDLITLPRDATRCPRCGSFATTDPGDGWIYCADCYETVAYRNLDSGGA